MKLSRICYALPRIALAAAIVVIVLVLGREDANHVSAQQTGDVELSLSATGTGVDCTPSQKPDKCTLAPGGQFILVVAINTIPLEGFRSYTLGVDHPQLISKDVRYAAASSSDLPFTFPVSGIGTTSFIAGATTSLSGAVATTYTGPLVEVDLNCPTFGAQTLKVSITLPPTVVRALNNDPIPITTTLQGADKVADTLTINCGEPVGGITELAPEASVAPLETGGSTGSSTGLLVAIAAATAVGAIAFGGAAWYTRRRWVK